MYIIILMYAYENLCIKRYIQYIYCIHIGFYTCRIFCICQSKVFGVEGSGSMDDNIVAGMLTTCYDERATQFISLDDTRTSCSIGLSKQP